MSGTETDREPQDSERAEIDPAPEEVEGEVIEPGIDPRTLRAVKTLIEHQGPLPSEAWLTTVEQLERGTTKRLVDDFLVERDHQRAIQRQALDIDRDNFHSFQRYQNRQLLAAWSVVTLIAAGGITLIALGDSIEGLIALVTELAVLAGVFLKSRSDRGKAGEPT